MMVSLYPEYNIRFCLQDRGTHLLLAIQMLFSELTPIGFAITILKIEKEALKSQQTKEKKQDV